MDNAQVGDRVQHYIETSARGEIVSLFLSPAGYEMAEVAFDSGEFAHIYVEDLEAE